MTDARVSRSRAHARRRTSTASSRRRSSSRSTSTSAAARRAAKRCSCSRAMRGSLKRVVRTPAPAGLRDRIGDAMAAERTARTRGPNAEADALGAKAPLVSLASWRTMVPAGDGRGAGARLGRRRRAARRPRRTRPAPASATICSPSSWPSTASRCRPRRATPTRCAASSDTWASRFARASFERGGARLVGGARGPAARRSGRRCSSTSSARATTRAALSVLVYDAQKIRDRRREPRPARRRHRRGARRQRAGLLRGGHPARRRRLPRRVRPRSGPQRAAGRDGLRRPLRRARRSRIGYPRGRDALRLRDEPDDAGPARQGHHLRLPARRPAARARRRCTASPATSTSTDGDVWARVRDARRQRRGAALHVRRAAPTCAWPTSSASSSARTRRSTPSTSTSR